MPTHVKNKSRFYINIESKRSVYLGTEWQGSKRVKCLFSLILGDGKLLICACHK